VTVHLLMGRRDRNRLILRGTEGVHGKELEEFSQTVRRSQARTHTRTIAIHSLLTPSLPPLAMDTSGHTPAHPRLVVTGSPPPLTPTLLPQHIYIGLFSSVLT
jgi:hypothetical protein